MVDSARVTIRAAAFTGGIRFLNSTVYASTLVLLAALAMPMSIASAAGVDPAARFQAAPEVDGKLSLPQSFQGSDETVTVVARLSADPITVVQAKQGRKLTAAEKQQIRSSLKGQQAALLPSIQALGATTLFEFQNSLNGIKVNIPRSKLAALAQLPGVVEVLPVAVHEHEDSISLIGAPAVWDAAGGAFHGEGIKIGVIDSGIDFTHANFGGPGTVAAFQNAAAHSTEPADPALFGSNAPKVKGGTDLVGDDYNASSTDPAKQVPHPDPNPLDCVTDGHGSHTGGTAGGFGVLSTGATYPGPYGATTFSSNTFNVPPGVAPKADLYAIRVFGCTGSTNVVDEAIEWAVDHDLDVINMSLGASYGQSNSSDSVASTNAVNSGVIVVASAGNAGSAAYIVGSPSVGDKVISVAATDSNELFPAVRLDLSTGKSVVAINANGVTTLPSGAIPVKVLRNPDNSISLGCDPQEYVNAGVAGKLVVTARGVCARVARAIFGQKAGAAAVAMINNAAGYPPFEGLITSNPDTGEQFTVTIPFLGIQGTGSDPTNLVAADGGTTTLTATTIANPTFKQAASFSSGGPRRDDSKLKPDVAAPGVSILSTLVGSGTLGTVMSGTSMAAPHTAGVAALALQAHPGWSAEAVSNAVVNAADPNQVALYNTRVTGGGLIQAPGAVHTWAVAFTDDGTSLNYGFAEIKSDLVKSKAIKVHNYGAAAATFNVSVGNQQGEPHTAVPSTNQLVVGAGQTATFNLNLTVPAASVHNDAAFRRVAGVVNLTPVAGSNNDVVLRMPYFLAARALSNVSAKLGPAPTSKNPSGAVALSNVGGPIAGNADFYALGIQSGTQAMKNPWDVRAVGLQSFDNPTATNPTRKLLVFAINTWGRWNSASTLEFDISIDVDGDGEPDYVVIGFDFGRLTAGAFDGRYGVFVLTLATGELRSNGFLASAPTDSSTVLLPLRSTDLCRGPLAPPHDQVPPCLSNTNPRIAYAVAGFLNFSDAFSAPSGVGLYNPWTPAITQGDFFTLAPNTTANSTVTINTAEWTHTPALGVLVVSTDNAAGASEAATLPVTLK
jgi:subtilisin family serine protease